MNPFAPLLIGLSLALGAGQALAEEPPLTRLKTSHDLYRLGLAEQEPLFLLAAARLRKTVPLAEGTLAPEGGTTVPDIRPLDAETMLAAASPLIAGDPALEGIAEDIRALRSKGVTSGPVYSIVTIKPGGRDSYPAIPFTGGKYAEIYVEGASGTDLNLLVHDGKNRLVCSDTDISAVAYCGWHPERDDRYTITVLNEAGKGGRYSLMSN